MVIVWIIVIIAAFILEAASAALVSIWFGAAAIPTLIAASMGAPLFLQLVIFTACSAIFLIFTRPAIKKLLPNKAVPTNFELEIGKTAVVTEKIDNEAGTGRVKLDGVYWAAVAVDDEEIASDEIVVVEDIRSAKLAVKHKVKM